jgi:hypothetical protein
MGHQWNEIDRGKPTEQWFSFFLFFSSFLSLHLSLSYMIYETRVSKCVESRSMAQVASRRPLIAEARVQSWVSPCGICGGQSGTWTGFSPSTLVSPCQFHSTDAPLHGKTKKETNHLHQRVAQ